MAFEEVRFTEVLSNIIDNRGKTCPTAEVGLPLIATNCIRNERLYPSKDKVRYVDNETYENWFRGHPEPGDIIFVTKGSPGRVCMTPDPVDFCIAQDMVAVRADESKVDPNYLFAVLRSRDVQIQIDNMHVGTMIPHFKKGDFDKLMLPIPNRATQRFIGDVYRLLSDKIELNRRMNQTLESLARAIFKSWFVDFDPVRAKMDGRPPPGLDPATAALFPASFEHRNGDLLPTGWEICALYDTATFINGAAFRSEHFCYPSDGLPVVKIAELKSGITGQTKFSNRTDLDPKYNIDTGALLYSWSGSPDTSLDTFLWTLGPGLLNQHIFKIETDSDAQKHFVYYLLKYLRPTLIEIARNKQTTGLGHVTVADMRRLETCLPPADILEAFEVRVGPVFDMCFLNSLESETLAALRDTLLPKLLSGELRVGEAAKLL